MLGTGLIKGMAETARNFVGSYFEADRLTTVQYPEERVPVKEAARSFPFLVFDGEDPEKGLRCVACQICEKECPPQCILIVKDTAKKPDFVGKMQFQPKIFDIDLSVCMSCQICVEVCPFEAIKMDVDFEMSRFDRFEGLLIHKRELSKSNGHFQKIHPTDAAAVDANLAAEKAKAEAKAAAEAGAKAKAAATAAAATIAAGAGAAAGTPATKPGIALPAAPAVPTSKPPTSPALPLTMPGQPTTAPAAISFVS